MESTTFEEHLTRQIWRGWQQQGTTPNMTYLEVQQLACQLTKICRENTLDYQNFDLQSALDATLSYDENLAALKQALGVSDKDYMAAVADQAETEFKTLQDLEAKNVQLERQNKKAQAKIKELEAKLKAPQPSMPQQQPQAVTSPSPTQPAVQEAETEYNPLTAPYSEEELAEINRYLQVKQRKQKAKCAANLAAQKTWQIAKLPVQAIRWVLF